MLTTGQQSLVNYYNGLVGKEGRIGVVHGKDHLCFPTDKVYGGQLIWKIFSLAEDRQSLLAMLSLDTLETTKHRVYKESKCNDVKSFRQQLRDLLNSSRNVKEHQITF